MSSSYKLRTVTNTVLSQLDLYRQLAGIEWKEEKIRLTGMLICLLSGFVFFFCLLLALSGMVLVFSWDTPYRGWAMAGLICFYGLGLWFACSLFQKLGNRSDEAFADTRAELAVDIALLRKRLDQ